MIKLTSLLKEVKDKNRFGCTMLFVDFPKMEDLHSQINPIDVYEDPQDDSFGLETDPHITLLFGTHEEVTLDEIKDKISGIEFGELIAYNISIFENPLYDVLKFNIKYPTKGGNFLSIANQNLKSLPHTSSFPNYHPHMTIGYLQKGMGKNYVNKFKDKEFNLTPSHIVYSEIDGTKTNIEL